MSRSLTPEYIMKVVVMVNSLILVPRKDSFRLDFEDNPGISMELLQKNETEKKRFWRWEQSCHELIGSPLNSRCLANILSF
jgi:hypothetical protein